MKVASMNIQNLFHRDISCFRADRAENSPSRMEEFQELLERPTKDDRTLERLRELSFFLGFGPQGDRSYMCLRRIAGSLYVKALGRERQPMASQRVGWNGWVALRSLPLGEGSQRAKAECIAQRGPDILVLQEVEDRAALSDFNSECLAPRLDSAFEQWSFVEGNDSRGRGHGIMVRNGYGIKGMAPHAHDRDDMGQGELFEMDSPEFTLTTPKGEELTIISTRFREGLHPEGRNKRKAQARMLRSIWDRLQAQGRKKVLICGNLGEVAYGKSLAPLLAPMDLRDIAHHPYFFSEKGGSAQGRPTTAGGWVAKHDYLLASPELYRRIQKCGMTTPVEKTDPHGQGGSSAPSRERDPLSLPIPPLLWVETEDV